MDLPDAEAQPVGGGRLERVDSEAMDVGLRPDQGAPPAILPYREIVGFCEHRVDAHTGLPGIVSATGREVVEGEFDAVEGDRLGPVECDFLGEWICGDPHVGRTAAEAAVVSVDGVGGFAEGDWGCEPHGAHDLQAVPAGLVVAVLDHLTDLALMLAQGPPDRAVLAQGDDYAVRIAGGIPGSEFEGLVEGDREPAVEAPGEEELALGYSGEGRVAEVVPAHLAVPRRGGPGGIAPRVQHGQSHGLGFVRLISEEEIEFLQALRPVPEHITGRGDQGHETPDALLVEERLAAGRDGGRAGHIAVAVGRATEDGAVPAQELLLEFGETLLVELPGGEAVRAAHGRGEADGLAYRASGAHYAGGGVGQVGGADQAAGQEQVVDVSRVTAAKGDAVQRRDAVAEDVAPGRAERLVVVEVVPAVSDVVGELPARLEVGLGQDQVAQETPTLALSGLGADPEQVPVPGLLAMGAVLDVVPLGPELVQQEFVDLRIVPDGVHVSAGLGDVEEYQVGIAGEVAMAVSDVGEDLSVP